jgi:hypothetical protein
VFGEQETEGRAAVPSAKRLLQSVVNAGLGMRRT